MIKLARQTIRKLYDELYDNGKDIAMDLIQKDLFEEVSRTTDLVDIQ